METSQGINDLKDTLAILEMSGRKTIKIKDVRYFLDEDYGKVITLIEKIAP